MRLSVVYGFDDAPSANRFLNDVNSNASLDMARAKLFDRDKVRISYSLEKGTYDNTLSILDDLSASYNGKEIQS
ncbi:hypothetical protein ACFO4O_16500 [Glaciecola siphonariae]|uniref:Uncharacterized protein n=1 Tax=Glaciecola siphonariae TaxID=521012 RepID=A0ABV9M029_9ALTE